VLLIAAFALGTTNRVWWKLAEYKLDVPPAWDGMAATQGTLYLTLSDGSVLCLGAKN
jgi:hypothetical protein